MFLSELVLILTSAKAPYEGCIAFMKMFFSVHWTGGCDDVMAIDDETLINKSKAMKYDYDLVVIGGGSGGLALAKVDGFHCPVVSSVSVTSV